MSHYVQKYRANGILDKIIVSYITPTLNEFRRSYYNIYWP